MKRFGFAIKTGGDPEIAGALAAGIERGTGGIRPHPSALGALTPSPKGEGFRNYSSEAVRRVAMMRHTPEEWEAMTVKARYDYGQDAPTPLWAERLLVIYAMVCMGVSWLYHRQDNLLRMNRPERLEGRTAC